MVTRVLAFVWLLFPASTILHALPVEVKTKEETPREEIPIKNEEISTTEESNSLVDLTAIEKLSKLGPAQVDDNHDGGKVNKHFGECEEIAEKHLDVSWSIKKKCLKMLWAEAMKEKKALKKLKSSKNVTKDVVTLGFSIIHRILYLIESLYLGARNTVLGILFPEFRLSPFWRFRHMRVIRV